jgi:hypothetical protein
LQSIQIDKDQPAERPNRRRSTFATRFRDDELVGAVAKSRSGSPSLVCAKFGVVPASLIDGFGTTPGRAAHNREASILASSVNSA